MLEHEELQLFQREMDYLETLKTKHNHPSCPLYHMLKSQINDLQLVIKQEA
ncbi:hypothetical protein ABC345_17295 [Shouchella sp. 1P09AA]|uniref:hypothetical protein n=1 Tax=unclassified Shouchella TaxID=2893065 RepID=UPI0039A05EC0